MDNCTHSLAAVLLAEALCEARSPARELARFRTAALWVSLLANNLPDLDFVYRKITPGKLGYLLHHRGHTHTVLGALALSLVAFGIVYGVARVRRAHLDARDLRALAALAVLGTLLHITMDLQNNYGVHPFWPFDDRWYYGDVLYIVEPLLLMVAIPVVALTSRTRIAAVGLTALLAGVLLFGATMRSVPLAQVFGLVFVAAIVALVARALPRPGRIALGIGAWLAVTLCFVVASGSVRRLVTASSTRSFPDTALVDVVRTPSPANPLCWSVIALGRQGDRYLARRAIVSLAPGVFSPRRCGSMDSRTATAPLTAIEATDGSVLWRSEFEGSLTELRTLARSHCDAAAFLRYARAPFWVPDQPTIVGDLRFDRSRALDFAEMTLSQGGACPPHVPPWTPPRAELLGD